jgi:cytochrome c oxidase subunit 4
MQSHEATEAHGHAAPQHTTTLIMYFGVFAALMLLTVLTVWISRIDLGAYNTAVALAVAIVKATLVILFFMHVIHSTRLTWVVVLGSFLWLGVLFVLTFSDYLTRFWSIY